MIRFRCHRVLPKIVLLGAACWSLGGETAVSAQAPAAGPPAAGGATAPGSAAPASSGPAPGISSGTPKPVPPRPLTLSDVVNIAVGGNSGLVIARQRLQQAQELIAQVNAQARPQFRVDAADTYSSYPAFAPTLTTPAISNPTLPGGGQIPAVVDNATSFSTAFVGGGGGGNAPSSGVSGSVGPGASTSPAGSASPTGGSTAGPGTTVPSSTNGGTVTSPTGTGVITTPTVPGTPATGGATAPSTTAPNTTAPAAPDTTAPSTTAPSTTAPSTTAPSTTAPSTTAPATPNTTAPNTAAPAAKGSALPSITSAYATDDMAEASPSREETPHSVQTAEADPRTPHDTTTGTGGTTTSTTTGVNGARAGQRNAAAARVSVSQYIDLFGLISTARSAQNNVRDFYSLDIDRLRNETALAAKNLFFNVLLTQEQVATQQEQVRYATEDVRITQERLKQGIVSRFDVLTAQTALSTAQQQLISAEDSRDLAQASLSYLLGTDPDQPIELIAPSLPPLTQTVDLPQSTQLALTHRPEVRQAGSNIEESRRLVKLAASTLLPTLGVVASGEQASLASTTAPRSYATITAVVAVPLDDGGATRSRIRSAQVQVQTQTLTLEQLKLAVALEVRQATLNIRNSQAQVGAAQTGVTQAQEALRLAYLRYQGGLGTFLDVLNALAQLAQTRDNLSSAEYLYQTSLAQLVRATGGR